MQLKRDNTENPEIKGNETEGMTNTQILRMYDQGFFDKKEEKEDEIKPESKYSNDYSRSGTNTNYVGTVEYEYDEKTEGNAFRITEEGMKEALAPTKKQIRDRNNVILLITGYVLYAVYGLVIFMFAKACMQDRVDILFNLADARPFIAVLEVYLLIDAVIVYVLYERKLTIFFMALLLGIIYPFYRRKLVTGDSSGIIITILIAFATVMILVNIRWATLDYGKVIHWEGATVRDYTAQLLDQETTNGVKMSTKINRHLVLDEASVDTKGGETSLSVSGICNIPIANMLNQPETYPATLVFKKTGESSDFVLAEVTLENYKQAEKYREKNVLTKNQLTDFNDKLMANY